MSILSIHASKFREGICVLSFKIFRSVQNAQEHLGEGLKTMCKGRKSPHTMETLTKSINLTVSIACIIFEKGGHRVCATNCISSFDHADQMHAFSLFH